MLQETTAPSLNITARANLGHPAPLSATHAATAPLIASLIEPMSFSEPCSPAAPRYVDPEVDNQEAGTGAALPDLPERLQSLGLYEEYQRFKDDHMWRMQGNRRATLQLTNEELAVRSVGRRQASQTHFQQRYGTFQDWKYRRTMSYWIAVFFLQGSILFAYDGLVGYMPRLYNLPFIKGLRNWPVFFGGILFFLGAYFACLETVKDLEPCRKEGGNPFTRKPVLHPEEPDVSRWPYLAALSYFIGTLIYPVGAVCDLFSGKSDLTEIVVGLASNSRWLLFRCRRLI
jgi:hypothetical protein